MKLYLLYHIGYASMELKYQRLVLIPRRLMPVMDINTGQHQLPRKWRMLEQLNLPSGDKAPPGWKKASDHQIFDVKMDSTRKVRWVKDGHCTPNRTTSSYADVVLHEIIRIALTYAASMKLDVQAVDISNAYIQASSSEKDYVICGEEVCLEHVGKVALIRRALYGGNIFWHHLCSCMKRLGFESSRADPDVWRREATKTDGTPYYDWVFPNVILMDSTKMLCTV